MAISTLWSAVRPAPRVTMLLGLVAVGSLGLHLTDPDHTGVAPDPVAAMAPAAAATVPLYVEDASDGTPALRVTLPDGRRATLVLEDEVRPGALR